MVDLRSGWRNLRIRLRFYNRLMLYNTLIFVAVGFFFAFVASRYAQQLDTIKQLQESRDALNAVFNYYDNKQNDFVNLVLPLYDPSDTYDTLSELLESPSDEPYENDAYAKEKVVRMMEQVAERDRDIAAVLIYKNRTGAEYLYTRRNRLLERPGTGFPFIREISRKTTGRTAYGTRTVSTGSLPEPVFGISGSLGSNRIRLQAGQFLFAYAAEPLHRVFETYAGKARGRFLIVTGEGEIVFDSTLQQPSGYGNGMRFPRMDIVKPDTNKVNIDGKNYYVQTIRHPSRKYAAINLIPTAEIRQSTASARFLIYGLFSAMAIVCAALYSIAGKFVSRRVNELIKGMKRVGASHLSYRIPQRGWNDEFEEIAARFNRMVHELERMIDREYVSEIRKKNAELKALQAGINPHFLYNTLEAIRIKASDDGNADVAEMIVMLAHLYRSMVRDRTFIEIRRELSLCGMYLNIFALRYDSSLDYSFDVDPRVMEYGIPKNLLQPIIENYFVHGIRLEAESNRFVVRGYLQQSDIVFEFDDNGRGMDQGRLERIRVQLEEEARASSSSGYGLSNVNERIRLVYGEPYGVRVESEEGRSTRVILRIQALTCGELERDLNISG